MSRFLCHLVPACALALASGCFLGHGRDGTDPVRDGGPPMPDPDASRGPPPPVVDAGRRPDPPPEPPPPPVTMCPMQRAVSTCLEGTFLVEPGEPFELPVVFDACGCCPMSECVVAVDHDSQRLSLSTAVCPDPCDCSGCYPVIGSCAVSALARGEWIVEVNGAEAFVLPVESARILESAPPPACATYALPDACAPSDPLVGAPLVPDEVCVVPGGIGVARVELIEDCPSCWLLDGPCEVEVEPRFTDDLPPGGEIRVSAVEYPTGCDVACSGECTQTTRSCTVPALANGEYYRVWVGGEIVLTFVQGTDGRVCSR